MKIVCSSKGTVDIEYDGKVARFSGELGIVGFKAIANSMKWLSPKNNSPVSHAERKKWIDAINEYYAKSKDRIIFVDNSGKEII
jgi:hypothetical protein